MDRYQYAEATFVEEDELLKSIRDDIRVHRMPEIFVPPFVGALLNWLVHSHHCRHILEIGALGGYSGVWLARALDSSGHLTSLELNPEYAEVARANLARAGLGDRVEYRVGPALDSLRQLYGEGERFDFFFIDADKENYPNYLEWAVKLAVPGAIIAADNALQDGRVYSPDASDASTVAIRRFNQMAAHHPELRALLLPVADGLVVAEVVKSSEFSER